MRPKTEKVIDPETKKWIEEGAGRHDDERYFALAWERALSEAQADISPVSPEVAREDDPKGA